MDFYARQLIRREITQLLGVIKLKFNIKPLFIPKNCQILAQNTLDLQLETYCCRRHTCTCATKILHHFGTGCRLPKTTFRTKIGGGLGQGSIQKIWDPLRISASVEASNFKFGTQIGFGTSLPKNDVFYGLGPKLARIWARGASKKNLGPPTYFCNRQSQQLKNWYTT